jgi:hypothetical protein
VGDEGEGEVEKTIFCKLKHHFSSELESVKGNPEDPGIDCPRSGSLLCWRSETRAAKPE